jgi:serine/threonine protein phosphatase PrpC
LAAQQPRWLAGRGSHQALDQDHGLSQVERLLQVGKKGTAEDVAEALAAKAQEAGSTDDVTVVALKLG